MSTTRISDIIVPSVFTGYQVQNTMKKSALFQSGVAVTNQAIVSQLQAGAAMFKVPYWLDLGDDEPDVVSDDPDELSTPKKIGSTQQLIRKSFLHQSWSAMNLASELAGSDAIERIQSRVSDYWTRQAQTRLLASISGIVDDNIANNGGDMVHDAKTENLGATNVIDAAGTLGDEIGAVKAIAMHSALYISLLKQDLIQEIRDSQGSLVMNTYRGMAVIVDDQLLPDADGIYTSVLFGNGAVGYGIAAPRVADGTEIENKPDAGNGGGMQILHSRINIAMHPLGFTWKEAAVAGDSPTLAELRNPLNWGRVVERKAVPMAFILTKG